VEKRITLNPAFIQIEIDNIIEKVNIYNGEERKKRGKNAIIPRAGAPPEVKLTTGNLSLL